MSGGFNLAPALARLSPDRPLVIVDADEVTLRFVDGFDRFLRDRGLYLDLTSYRLQGNVKSRADNATLLDIEVTALLEEFRQDLDSLEAVPGARESLANLSRLASIVVLSKPTFTEARPQLAGATFCRCPWIFRSSPTAGRKDRRSEPWQRARKRQVSLSMIFRSISHPRQSSHLRCSESISSAKPV